MSADKQYRTFETKVMDLKKEDGEAVFSGYGAVFGNKDQGGDIIIPGAFRKTISDNDGKFHLLADHEMTMSGRLGIAYAKEDERGVNVKGHINTETRLGQDVYSHLKQAQRHGVKIGMSFGYTPVQKEYDSERDARLLREIKTYEFTITQIPMNEMAAVTTVKSLAGEGKFAEAIKHLEQEKEHLENGIEQLKALLPEPPEGTSAEAAKSSPEGGEDAPQDDELARYLKRINESYDNIINHDA